MPRLKLRKNSPVKRSRAKSSTAVWTFGDRTIATWSIRAVHIPHNTVDHMWGVGGQVCGVDRVSVHIPDVDSDGLTWTEELVQMEASHQCVGVSAFIWGHTWRSPWSAHSFLCIKTVMKDWIWEPGVVQSFTGPHSPASVDKKKPGDEVFGFFRCFYKLLLLEVPLTGQDVIQGLVVIVPKKGTESTQ